MRRGSNLRSRAIRRWAIPIVALLAVGLAGRATRSEEPPVLDDAGMELRIEQTEATLSVLRGDTAILVYNLQSPPVPAGILPVYQRSGFLHPVNTPQGRTVTAAFPADHPHQHGIFSAWVNTTYAGRPVDFWNLAGGTGRVLHERVVRCFQEHGSVGWEANLLHRATAEPPVDVLRERWKVTVHSTDGSYHLFDLETTQQALTDQPLVINQYHYGGIALRGPTRWVTPRDGDAEGNSSEPREPSEFLNDRGSDRLAGNHQHARWVALTGTLDGATATIAVLAHRDNFRSPQAARLHPTKPYFCFAPCVDGEFSITREQPFTGRYRYLLTDAAPDPQWLDEQWSAWCGPSPASPNSGD